MFVSATVPHVVEELAEASKVFSQDRVQQRFGEQTIETPAVSLDEKIVEVPVTHARKDATGCEHTCADVNTYHSSTALYSHTVSWNRDGSPSHEKWWKGARDGASQTRLAL